MVPASSTRPSWSQQCWRSAEVGGFAGRGDTGETSGGHVEEAVEVDAESPVVHGAQQLGGRRAPDRLMHSVGGGEGVVHFVPVPVVVLGVEAGDPQRGGVGDCSAELFGVGAGGDGVVDRGDDLSWIFGQD